MDWLNDQWTGRLKRDEQSESETNCFKNSEKNMFQWTGYVWEGFTEEIDMINIFFNEEIIINWNVL